MYGFDRKISIFTKKKMTTTIDDVQFIELPRRKKNGLYCVDIEKNSIPFLFKRIYYLYDIPTSAKRGGHAHIAQNEILIAIKGSFDVLIDDGLEKKTIKLDSPTIGFQIVTGIWRDLDNFSEGSICMVLAQDVYDENDYIREYEDFLVYKKTS